MEDAFANSISVVFQLNFTLFICTYTHTHKLHTERHKDTQINVNKPIFIKCQFVFPRFPFASIENGIKFEFAKH